jgi:hypothetical protein
MLKDILSFAVLMLVCGSVAVAGTWWDRKHRKR